MTAPLTPEAVARRLTRDRQRVTGQIVDAFLTSIHGLSLGQAAGLRMQLLMGVDQALDDYSSRVLATGIQTGADTTGTALRIELTPEEADSAVRADTAWAERERIAALVRAARQPGPTWALLESLAVRIERGEE